MRIVNTSRISQTLTLTHKESGAETQVLIAPGVQSLPAEYTIGIKNIPHYESIVSLVGDDGSVVPLSRLGVNTVVETESESQSLPTIETQLDTEDDTVEEDV